MAARKPSADKPVDFENALKQLETLVGRMERGDMSLEESLQAFEEGVKLTRLCQETLAAAQQKVQVLVQQDGKADVQPFASDEGNEANDSDAG